MSFISILFLGLSLTLHYASRNIRGSRGQSHGALIITKALLLMSYVTVHFAVSFTKEKTHWLHASAPDLLTYSSM